jgi:bacterioferritin-associated ferredoxin
METIAQYVIPLDPKSKKNSHRIAGCGTRCPVCGKYAKQFVRNGNTTTEFAFHAAKYLRPKPWKPIEGPVHLIYRLYTATWHRKDDLNLYEALDDILVKEGILKDDDRKTIRNRDGSRVLYDKDNPRAEIYIYEYKEEDDIWLRKAVQKCLLWINSLASTKQPTD